MILRKKTFIAGLLSTISILLVAGIGFFAFGDVAHAGIWQTYVNCTGANCQLCNVFELINGVIKFLIISVAAPLAAVSFAIAGIMLFTAGGNEEKIKKAKSIFLYVVIGLLIALSAFLVIDTIMKSLLNTSTFTASGFGPWNSIQCAAPPLAQPPLGVAPANWSYCVIITGTTQSCISNLTQTQCTLQYNTAISQGKTATPCRQVAGAPSCSSGALPQSQWAQWAPGELATRAALNPITVNKNPCPPGCPFSSVPAVGGLPSGCTNVAGLATSAINGVKSFQASCGCAVQITGGTELGHAVNGNHGVGLSGIDISKNSAVDNYITSNGTLTTSAFGGYTTYTLNGATYVDETTLPAHWHVVY